MPLASSTGSCSKLCLRTQLQVHKTVVFLFHLKIALELVVKLGHQAGQQPNPCCCSMLQECFSTKDGCVLHTMLSYLQGTWGLLHSIGGRAYSACPWRYVIPAWASAGSSQSRLQQQESMWMCRSLFRTTLAAQQAQKRSRRVGLQPARTPPHLLELLEVVCTVLQPLYSKLRDERLCGPASHGMKIQIF